MLYTYSKFSKWDFWSFRLLGPGLCNLLFPWARCVLASERYGLTPISPTWSQIKVGPILRREPDKRFYFDLFKKNPKEVSGVRKVVLLLNYPSVTEDYLACLEPAGYPRKDENKIILFEGLGDYFEPFITDYTSLEKKLLEITRDEHKKGLTFDFCKSLSVHIRLGDFKGQDATPIEWYVDTLQQLRQEFAADWPIYVFSDGADEEFAPVLRLPGCRRLDFGSSLADLLALSRAQVLIGSAGSTFSQWASFLGRMPVIWGKGGLKQRLYYDHPLSEIERAQGEKLPESFVALCRQDA